MYEENKKSLTIDEAAVILSDTLKDVAERRTTIRRALAISRLALALSKVIEIQNLRDRVEFLEQALKKRK
ncbi:MAG: hypothetical protein WC631_03060 [Candidatus Paceibacterota bacterium]|jgi:hypothetical protein